MDIILTDTAAALVKADVGAFKRDAKRYAAYVADMGVTAETLPDHVKVFRDAFRAACPKAGGDEVKAYATKVRNGLRYHLPKVDQAAAETDYLAAVVKAALKACEHAVPSDAVLKAVSEALG